MDRARRPLAAHGSRCVCAADVQNPDVDAVRKHQNAKLIHQYTIDLELDSGPVSRYDTPGRLVLEEGEKLYAILQKIPVAVDEGDL